MHKKLLTLALSGVAIIGVLAGASYFSGGSLLSSVLPTTTTPTCQEQENDVSLAQDALKQFPERANITERVAVLQEAVNTAAGNVTKIEQVAFAAAKKLRYSDLSALMSDYKKYTELAQKMSAKNVEIKKSTAEVTRLSRLKPRTADVSAQIKKEQVKLSAIKEELSKINKERSVLNASIKKITRSTTTIDVLYNKYIKKAVSNISEAQKSLSEAQKSLELVLTEQKPIVNAETKLASAEKALEMCRAKTPETPKESVTYCFPTYQGADGDVQTNCVDDVSKIPQCYVKSTTTAIYDDETGELSSVNVVSDDNTKELFFCGDPETAYLDSANPTSGYPTMPGQGSNPGAEAAAPMGAENPNSPINNPVKPEDNETKICESGIVVAKTAQCPEEAKCGNDVCEYGEDHNSCPDDCALDESDIVETCGNGIIDDGEDCDTGEREGKWNSSCMACSFHCNSEPITNYAGDGPKSNYMIVKMGHPRSLAETQMHEIGFKPGLFDSDELKNNTNACLYTILPCGNGKVDTFPIDSGFGSETCDDGNFINDDGCSEYCQKEVCGDGIKQRNEECDYHDAVQSGFECTEQCKLLEIRKPG